MKTAIIAAVMSVAAIVTVNACNVDHGPSFDLLTIDAQGREWVIDHNLTGSDCIAALTSPDLFCAMALETE